MGLFVLSSDITIGTFHFSGVHEVRIKRSLHSIADTATITVPSICKVLRSGKAEPGILITGYQFNDGDPVTIKLGYNNNLVTEFRGFVKRRNLNIPLEVQCEGYSWQLRRNTINKFDKSVAVKDLLALAVSGTDNNYPIKVQCQADVNLGKVQSDNTTGFDLINKISEKTDHCLTCFFKEPDVLWCGLVYTAYAQGKDIFNSGTVAYELGYNVLKDNSLMERDPDDDPVQVTYSKKMPDGSKISAASDAFKSYVRKHDKILNHLEDEQMLKALANEKANKLNYAGYEGRINAFLEPYAAPGYTAKIIDDRYKERNGIYLIESTEVVFGVKGGRRIVEIGPKVADIN